jgi:hypothetical protein
MGAQILFYSAVTSAATGQYLDVTLGDLMQSLAAETRPAESEKVTERNRTFAPI